MIEGENKGQNKVYARVPQHALLLPLLFNTPLQQMLKSELYLKRLKRLRKKETEEEEKLERVGKRKEKRIYTKKQKKCRYAWVLQQALLLPLLDSTLLQQILKSELYLFFVNIYLT